MRNLQFSEFVRQSVLANMRYMRARQCDYGKRHVSNSASAESSNPCTRGLMKSKEI